LIIHHSRLQLDLVVVFVEEVEFGKMVVRILPDLNLLAILPAPFPLFRFEHGTFCKVGVHNRMYNQGKIFMLVGDEVTEVLFNFIFQQQGRRNFTRTGATGTYFLGIDIYLRFHPLPGYLH
jgi:hypothetical protein